MQLLVLVMLFVCIGLPLAYVWRVWRLDEPCGAGWLIAVAEAAALVVLVLLLGRWDMAGYYVRFLLPVVFLAAALRSFGRHAARPWTKAGTRAVLRDHRSTLASLILLCAALAYVFYGMLPPDKPRELAFPLEGGRFVVGQGGGIGLLNRHAGHPEQRYAADITAINRVGYRAAGLFPRELEQYVIFGAAVVSPCEGTVVAGRDGLPDLVPPEADRDNPAGNHVIVDCGGIHVELAHLQQGSVAVEAGEPIGTGEPIGRVGNSGNTSEPHLHVHAVDPETRAGVPLSFGGRAPLRNRLYVN